MRSTASTRRSRTAFLPFVESGVVTLVGATTENPSFEINGALLSRCQVLVLKRLEEAALRELISRAEALEGRPVPVVNEAVAPVLAMADGDGRYLLNIVEQLYALAGPTSVLSLAQVTAGLQKRAPAYDKAGDGHYNLISALHKAVRGSDPDAALYWFARMIDGGEDPLYLARRLVRMASEDIGLADPTALMVTSEAARAYERMGSPEGELALAHAVIHLATAPKSNAAYVAWKAALQSARETGSLMPPKHILNAPTKMMKDQGYGAGYAYDHDTEEGVSGQDYFPDGMERQSFYQPKGEGREKSIAERLAWIAKIRDRKGGA
jgi:putative ATPase